MSKLAIVPMTIREAVAFVRQHHRHRQAPQGALFAIGLSAGDICGVAIVGRPTARLMDDGWTVEVTRLCTDGTRNACSMLYRACWRAARAMGYRKLITYTLKHESGASLRACGMRVEHETRAQSWHRDARPRVDLYPMQRKLRWAITEADADD